MRLLVVTNDFPPRIGGIQTYVHEIVSRLEDEVTVLASTSPGAAAFDHTFRHRVIRAPTTMLLPTPSLRARIDAVVRASHADLVLFGAAMPLALLGRSVLDRAGVPYASFTHGAEAAAVRVPGGGMLLRRIGQRAAFVTAVSQWTRDILRPFVEGARLELLPSGVDLNRFHPGVDPAPVRARHGLGPGPVIVCVSRLVRRKGQDALIRALPAVLRAHASARLLLVGPGADAGRLRRLAAAVGVRDQVIFAGAVPEAELPMYFRVGDVFAMPCRSRWGGLDVEAFGLVYLQAAAVGRPVVAGRSGGTADALVDGDTGSLVNGANVDEVARAILAILARPDRGARMGALGAERVRQSFGWDQIAARCRALLVDAVTPASTGSTPRVMPGHL